MHKVELKDQKELHCEIDQIKRMEEQLGIAATGIKSIFKKNVCHIVTQYSSLIWEGLT